MTTIDLLAFGDDTERDAWRLACGGRTTATAEPRFALALGEAWRSDALLPDAPQDPLADQLMPEELVRDRAALWNRHGGMVALSLQGDLLRPAWRHQRSGRVIHASTLVQKAWSTAQRERLARECVPVPILSPDESAGHLRRIIGTLFDRGVAVVLLITCFRHAAGAWARRPIGVPAAESLRAQRFNQMVVAASHDTGAYVIDADQALGATGAKNLRRSESGAFPRASIQLAREMVGTLYRGGPMDNFIDDAASVEPTIIGDDVGGGWGHPSGSCAPTRLTQSGAQPR